MKTTVYLLVAGLAAAASAQTMTMYWTYGNDVNGDGAQTLSPNEVGTAYLWATWDTDVTGFAGSIFDFTHDGSSGDYGITLNYDLGDLQDPGEDDGMGTITGIETFQLPPFFNPDFVADNPVLLVTFTYAPDTYVPHTVNFTTYNHQNFSVYVDDFGSNEEYTGIVEGGFFNIVPAPASMALLGLGGLAATRRRR